MKQSLRLGVKRQRQRVGLRRMNLCDFEVMGSCPVCQKTRNLVTTVKQAVNQLTTQRAFPNLPLSCQQHNVLFWHIFFSLYITRPLYQSFITLNSKPT